MGKKEGPINPQVVMAWEDWCSHTSLSKVQKVCTIFRGLLDPREGSVSEKENILCS